MAESQKEKLMRVLNISADEAQAVMDYDYKVDHNKPTEYDLTDEQKENVKSLTRQKSAEKVYTFTKRERKPNEVKGDLIKYLAEVLEAYEVESLEITNKERQIAFSVGDEKFELTLTQKRKPK